MHLTSIYLIVVGAFLSYVASSSINTTVLTSSGWVQGAVDATHKYWLGVPYAQPPIGNLRWQPPQPPVPWSGVKQTTAFGSECTQTGGGHEDCLYLNVFSPIYPTGKLLPVYIWVHGGGFVAGSGSFNPEYLAGNETVIVTINYRLGTLGFFASEQILNQSSVPTTGFYGIQDQRFTFAWVQKNIEAFGGDPSQVTIGGESAGGNSMCIHLAAPRSGGLFDGIIMESGLCGIWDWQTGIEASANVVIKAGCSGAQPSELACMMAKNASLLIAAYQPPNGGFVYYPTMHPYEFTQFPLQLIQQGTYNKVPILAGTNADEGANWVCPLGNITEAQYTQVLDRDFNATLAALVFNEYPLKNYAAPINALIDITSDIWFKCMTSDVLIAKSTNTPSVPSYMYSFEHIASTETDKCLGVPHGGELAYVFGWGPFTAQETLLSQTMVAYWRSFIISGKPEGPIPWPLFNASTQSYLALNLDITVETQFRQPYCQFWNQHPQDPAIQP